MTIINKNLEDSAVAFRRQLQNLTVKRNTVGNKSIHFKKVFTAAKNNRRRLLVQYTRNVAGDCSAKFAM